MVMYRERCSGGDGGGPVRVSGSESQVRCLGVVFMVGRDYFKVGIKRLRVRKVLS